MSRVILLVVLFVTACAPFIDRRREAGAKTEATLYVGESKPAEPAVCYSSWTTNYETVKKLADEECVKQKTGTHAVPFKQTLFSCRLLIPNHLYFRCEK